MMQVLLYVKYVIYRIKSYFTAKNPAIIRQNIGKSQPHTIAILFSVDGIGKYELLQDLLQSLKALDHKISAFGYVSNINKIGPLNSSIQLFSHHDFTYWGKVDGEVIKRLQCTSFDYLLHVDVVSNPLLDYIIAKSQAKCRVGCFTAYRKALFEVMIKIKPTTKLEDTKRLIDQMVYYISVA